MKRPVVSALLAAVMLFSGCIGSFSLTNRLYSWNEKATNDRYVNSALLWLLGYITPIYGGCIFIDAVVLNTIEFWTGKNPMSFRSPGKIEKMVTSENGTSKVTMGNDEITISKLDGVDAGKSITLRYDPAQHTFHMIDANGQKKIGWISGTTLNLYSPDGRVTKRSLSETDAVIAGN
jgi:hypothetical protein